MFISGHLHAGEAEKLLGPGLDASAAQTGSKGPGGPRLDSMAAAARSKEAGNTVFL